MRILFSIVFSLIFSNLMAQNPQLKIKRLAGNLYTYKSYNIYKGTITEANSVYLVTPEGVVLIDAPWDSTQFQPFLDSIETKHHKKVVLAIATHAHEDRAGGLAFFKSKGINAYATKQTNELLRKINKPVAQFTFTGDTTFKVGGYSIKTYYAGKGHTADNIVIWFEQDKVLFGGCLVKSTDATDLGYIGEAYLKDWPQSILNLQKKYKGAKYLIPGHGSGTGLNALINTLNLLEQSKTKP